MFNARYPGLDPLKLTVAKFIRWVDLAPLVSAFLNGKPSREMMDDLNFDQMERRLIVMTKLGFKVV